jgi:small subunit ribosomal protein S5
MAGIKNLLSKCYGSTNPINMVKATLAALSQLRTPESVAALRGVEL